MPGNQDIAISAIFERINVISGRDLHNRPRRQIVQLNAARNLGPANYAVYSIIKMRMRDKGARFGKHAIIPILSNTDNSRMYSRKFRADVFVQYTGETGNRRRLETSQYDDK
jgi:hypothetical protein